MGSMEDALAMLKSHSASAKRRASMYKDVATVANNKTINDVSALNNASRAGKHLQKVGFIMMWIPEPTGATCAVGAPMILAGRYIDKMNGGSLSDVTDATQGALERVKSMNSSMI